MFDVIFVTYKSIMTVSTRKACTPPSLAGTPPHQSCSVYVLYLFSKKYNDAVSANFPILIQWTYPFNAVLLVHALHLLYYNDVSTSMYPQGADFSSVCIWSRSL